jgi:excisionase family DNA binding protein
MAKASEGALTLLTPAAAAARLGCSDMHVYRLIAAGELDAVDIAQPGARRSKTRVRSDDVDSYIKARTRRNRREPTSAA